jgi:hypothetical protein
MKISKYLLTTAALVASFGASANAQVTGSLGGGVGTFHALSISAPAVCGPCTLGPGVATILGGTTYNADQPFADIPKGGVFGGNFLSAGPTSTGPAIMTFNAPLSYISFLWGSPDTYNQLKVNSTSGTQIFTAAGMGFASTNGNQAYSQYVQFAANAGVKITSLEFASTTDAFETANFSTTSTVPEPSTYALMGAGLAALAFASKRRKLA